MTEDIEVDLPYGYKARPYQDPFWDAMVLGGIKRACLVWHRRSGKSKTLLNFAIWQALRRVGTYYHAFPEYGQARKIIWDGIDKTGVPFLDHIPKPLRRATNKSELKVELINGSIYQLIGADNYDSLVGPNPIGLILDEWAVSDRYPMAWDYFRPILAENGGWAVFPYTPRGRNHGFSLYSMALSNPDWFCQLLTVDDTHVIGQADIEAERNAGMSEDMIQQEFYCSFLASTEDILIPFTLIQVALRRDNQFPDVQRVAGCDPARFGDDRTGFAIRQGGRIVHLEAWHNLDTIQIAGKLMLAHEKGLFNSVNVDVIGIGAGVYDLVKAKGIPCLDVNVGRQSTQPSKFVRLRDELWWALREWFEDGRATIGQTIPQKYRDAFIADIQDIHYDFTPTGSRKIEDKQHMKDRLKFSPDLGDAVCLTFAKGGFFDGCYFD